MEGTGKYIIEAVGLGETVRATNLRRALMYAKAITGPGNVSTSVWEEKGLANVFRGGYRYSDTCGGTTYKVLYK